MLEKVFIRLISKDKKEVYGKAQYFEFLDLVGIYCTMEETDFGIREGILKSSACETLDIAPEKLHSAAMSNTNSKGWLCRPIHNVINEILGEELEEPVEGDCGSPMYVITNAESLYGASVLLFSEEIDTFAEKIGEDLYLLPSSVHEILAVPVSTVALNKLQEMVRDANQTMVSPGDFLSNNIYYFSRKAKVITIAEED